MGRAIIKDKDWAAIDGEVCRVTGFTPLTKVEDRRAVSPGLTTPYALISFECARLPADTTGAICHRVDFEHLWAAFREVGVRDDEEVLIAWNKKRQKGIFRLLSIIMPGFWVGICPKGAFELADQSYKPELNGLARFRAEMPIIDWMPPNLGDCLVSEPERSAILLERVRTSQLGPKRSSDILWRRLDLRRLFTCA